MKKFNCLYELRDYPNLLRFFVIDFFCYPDIFNDIYIVKKMHDITAETQKEIDSLKINNKFVVRDLDVKCQIIYVGE